MKTIYRIIAVVGLALFAAHVSSPVHAGPQPQEKAKPATPDGDRLTPSELEELLGSIALFPDPLLANVLAASVYPDEVAEAAKFMAGGGKPEQVDAKSWEAPVKAVAKIPEAIKMMGEYPEWTIALGQAYLIQAKDVMDVVQSLRKKAQSNGALVTSPQQSVVVEKEIIYIQPANPQIIYVPTYSPSVVYVDDDDDEVVAGVIGFGVGIAAGLIIANNMDCDWHGGCVGWGYGGYHGHGGYHSHNDVDIDINRGDVNIDGDVNIGNNTFEGGDRTTNIQGGDRTNVSGGDRTNIEGGTRVASQNRVGNEGNAWAPNASKPLASSKPSELSRVKQGATKRPGAGAAAGQANTGANRAGGTRSAQQPSARTGDAAASGNNRPSRQPDSKSRVPASRPPASNGGRTSDNGKGAAQTSRNTPASAKPSAYEGGKNTKAASQRGNASRSKASSNGGGGSGSRSAPAPARSGSGGRGGGGGRR